MKDQEIEEWVDIKGFENLYQISSFGRVKRLPKVVTRSNNRIQTFKEHIFSYCKSTTGYNYVNLVKDKKKFRFKNHRIVAESFISNPENKPCVNHKDGNKINNHVNNLEWCTYSENTIHSFKELNQKPSWLGRTGSDHTRSMPISMYKDGILIGKYDSMTECSFVN